MRIFAAIAVFVFAGAYCFESHNARRWKRKAHEALASAEFNKETARGGYITTSNAVAKLEMVTLELSNAVQAAELWKQTAILWKEIARQSGVDTTTNKSLIKL